MNKKNTILIILGGLVSFLLTLVLLYLFSPRRKTRVVTHQPDLSSTEKGEQQIIIEATRAGETDDLEMIVGIGPKISSALQEAGIYTFAQLSRMTTGEIQQILDRAQVQAVASQDWINQARNAGSGSS